MIFVECDPDEVLVKSLTRGKIIKHPSNKPRVCSQLAKTNGSVAMVDEDPKSVQHPYIDKLKGTGQVSFLSGHDLTVLCDKSRDNRIVLICPRLEDWLLKAASEAGLNIEDYFLPRKPSGLHDVLTLGNKNNKHMDNYKKLLYDLGKSSTRVKTLKELLGRSA